MEQPETDDHPQIVMGKKNRAEIIELLEQGLNSEQMAERLGISVNAVYARIYRTRNSAEGEALGDTWWRQIRADTRKPGTGLTSPNGTA